MPEIREYNQQVSLQGPVRTQKVSVEDIGGGQGLQVAGKALEYAGDAIYKRAEQDEISQATADLSAAHVEFTKRLNDQVQQGNVDPEQFSRDLDEYTAKTGDNLSTRGGKEYFARANAAMQQHFTESAIVSRSELAAEKAKTNLVDTLNNYSSANMHDPSGYQMSLDNFNSFVDSSVQGGHLPAVKGEELKNQGKKVLAEGAVRGWMGLNPTEAKAQLEAGHWDDSLNSDMVKQLTGEAEQGIRAKRLEDARIQQAQLDAKAAAQNVTQNDFLDKMSKGQLSTKDILNSNLEPFGSGSKEQFLNILKANTHAKVQSDSYTFHTLLKGVHAEDGDPSKITDENYLNQFADNGTLSPKDLQFLRNEMQHKGTEQGKLESMQLRTAMRSAEDTLVKSNPMLGIKDAEGMKQLAAFESEYAQQFREERAKGKSVDDLTNPKSPDYLGSLLEKYKKTPTEIMQGNMEAMRPKVIDPVVARKPGESASDYLKRTKKP